MSGHKNHKTAPKKAIRPKVTKAARSGPPVALRTGNKYQSTSGLEERVVSGQLYLGTLQTGATPVAGDLLFENYLHPNVVEPSPLAALSMVFDKYEFLEAEIRVTPSVGTQTNGDLFGWFDVNPNAAAPTAATMGEVTIAHKGGAQWRIWDEGGAKYVKSHTPDKQFYTATEGDAVNWAQAMMRIGSPVALTANTLWGHAYLKYRVRFFDPQLDVSAPGGEGFSVMTNGGNNTTLWTGSGDGVPLFGTSKFSVSAAAGLDAELPTIVTVGGTSTYSNSIGYLVEAGDWFLDSLLWGKTGTRGDSLEQINAFADPVTGDEISDGVSILYTDVVGLATASAADAAFDVTQTYFSTLRDMVLIPLVQGLTTPFTMGDCGLIQNLIPYALNALKDGLIFAVGQPGARVLHAGKDGSLHVRIDRVTAARVLRHPGMKHRAVGSSRSLPRVKNGRLRDLSGLARSPALWSARLIQSADPVGTTTGGAVGPYGSFGARSVLASAPSGNGNASSPPALPGAPAGPRVVLCTKAGCVVCGFASRNNTSFTDDERVIHCRTAEEARFQKLTVSDFPD